MTAMKGARWTEEELQFVRDNAASMHDKALAYALKRTYGAVRLVRSITLSIKRGRPGAYTDAELAGVRLGLSVKATATLISRSEYSVRRMRRRLGVRRRARPKAPRQPARFWPPEKVALLKQLVLVEGHTVREAARRMGIGPGAVTGKLDRLRREQARKEHGRDHVDRHQGQAGRGIRPSGDGARADQ